MRRFRREVVQGTARQFVEAKLAERDERHRRAGESRYRVEPNIKDGKGGLRDLHTLHWLAKYIYGHGPSEGGGETSIFLPDEQSHLPPLRELPVVGQVPSAFSHRPRRRAADASTCSRPWPTAWATSTAAA